MAGSSDYLDSILRSQGQSKVTGRGALTSPQIEAAFRGELAARYESDVSRTKEAFQESATTRSLDISQQGADTQRQSMLNAKEATDAQIAAGKTQTIVSGVGAAGQAAIGGALVRKAFFDTAPKAGAKEGTASTTTTTAGATTEGTTEMGTALSTYGVTDESIAAFNATTAASSAAEASAGAKGATEVIQAGGELAMGA